MLSQYVIAWSYMRVALTFAWKAYYCTCTPEILPTSHLVVAASTMLENAQAMHWILVMDHRVRKVSYS